MVKFLKRNITKDQNRDPQVMLERHNRFIAQDLGAIGALSSSLIDLTMKMKQLLFSILLVWFRVQFLVPPRSSEPVVGSCEPPHRAV